jgi:phosphopentomutase
MLQISNLWNSGQQALIFANLVDFDMIYGHRRDVGGYANALREFDHWFDEFRASVRPDDLVIVTADHGNDPTFRGTDHTREEVPLFVLHDREQRGLGTRETFADIAATLADYFELENNWPVGRSFLS